MFFLNFHTTNCMIRLLLWLSKSRVAMLNRTVWRSTQWVCCERCPFVQSMSILNLQTSSWHCCCIRQWATKKKITKPDSQSHWSSPFSRVSGYTHTCVCIYIYDLLVYLSSLIYDSKDIYYIWTKPMTHDGNLVLDITSDVMMFRCYIRILYIVSRQCSKSSAEATSADRWT